MHKFENLVCQTPILVTDTLCLFSLQIMGADCSSFVQITINTCLPRIPDSSHRTVACRSNPTGSLSQTDHNTVTYC